MSKDRDFVLSAEPRPYHGLSELATRHGWRHLADTQRGAAWLSERTIFRDSATGCIAWRLTCDPSVDVNDYDDIPGWNANGSLLGFLSRRRGAALGAGGEDDASKGGLGAVFTSGRERWVMDANGDHLRPMPAPGGEMIQVGFWSRIYPDRFYHSVQDEAGTRVLALNPYTGEETTVVSVARDLGLFMPPHPSEQWFLYGDKVAGDVHVDDTSFARVVALDGTVRDVKFERRWHRLRFTKGADQRLFFNFDEPRTQWTILPDGTERHALPDAGGHPDWVIDGSELTYFFRGAVWGIKHDGSGKRQVIELGSGGHGGPCLDMEWFCSDTPHNGKYPGSILSFRLDGSGVCHTLFRHMSSMYAHTARGWHPDHHATHPHPNTSPDGTKIVFNSDLLGQYTDLYVVIGRYPDPPQNLRATTQGGEVLLSWEAPRRGREVRGYCVYRSARSGMGYERVADGLTEGLEWRGPIGSEPGCYVVTAVEWSGLESRPSNEAFGLGNNRWQGPVRLVLEAEDGTAELPMQEVVEHVTASNGFYVASPTGEVGGELRLPVDLPKGGRYTLWARVRGNGALAVSCDGQACGAVPCAADRWTWARIDAPRQLPAGRHELKLATTTGHEQVDKLVVTDDLAFAPHGMMSLDETPPAIPVGLQAKVISPNTIHVTWDAVRDEDFDHYNIYCGRTSDTACTQGTLVGSPSSPEFVDWGLELNTACWYRVTAVDRAGNESAATAAVGVTTPAFRPVRIELLPGAAQVEGMELAENAEVGGQLLRPIQGATAQATWTFEVPRAGLYAIWGRSTHPRPANERVGQDPAQFLISHFEVVLDGKTCIPWEAWGFWGEYHWSPAGAMVTGTPQLYQLAARKHTLTLHPGTAGSVVAGLVITDDPTWSPVVGMKR